MAYQVPKDGVQPSNLNLKAIAECAPPQTYNRDAYLPRLGWSLPKIYQEACMYCTTTQQPFDRGRSQQEIQTCVTFRGCPEGF